MPEKTKDTARQVIAKVVEELMDKLESRTTETIRGAIDKRRRTRRPRHGDIDWPRTIAKNLRHWQPEHRTIVPETLVGFGRDVQARQPRGGDPLRRPVGLHGDVGGLFLGLRRGDGVDPGDRAPSSWCSTPTSSI